MKHLKKIKNKIEIEKYKKYCNIQYTSNTEE